MVDSWADIMTGQVYDALLSKQTLQSLKYAIITETKAADPEGDAMDIYYYLFTFYISDWVF